MYVHYVEHVRRDCDTLISRSAVTNLMWHTCCICMYVASVASGAAAYLDCCCHRYPHCHHRHHHYHIRMTLGTGAARININNNMTPPQAVAKKHDSAASAAKCILCVNSPTVRRGGGGGLDREQQQRVGGGDSVVELTQISCPCQLNLCMQNSLSHMHTVDKQTHIHTYNCISLFRGTC